MRFPVQLQQSIASNGIVHRFSEKVNMKILENTQGQQFKRWFGDWQNDPAQLKHPLFPADWHQGVDGADFAIQARAATSLIQNALFSIGKGMY